jgi:DNA-binding transcriptional MerR regulator
MSADGAGGTTVAPDGTRAGRTRKSAKAFRTISEVSDVLDVPQHVLRFWETKFSQIRPMKRGGGRRYYRPEDITLLRGVRELLYDDGYTIKGVQKLLREGGVKVLQERANGLSEEAPQPAPAAEAQANEQTVELPPEGDSLEAVLAELEDICRRLRKAL